MNMLHKHHSTHHAIGLLLAIVVIGGVLGGMSGIVGRKMVRESGAYESEVTRNNARQSRLMQRRLSRMKAREARLKRLSPMLEQRTRCRMVSLHSKGQQSGMFR